MHRIAKFFCHSSLVDVHTGNRHDARERCRAGDRSELQLLLFRDFRSNLHLYDDDVFHHDHILDDDHDCPYRGSCYRDTPGHGRSHNGEFRAFCFTGGIIADDRSGARLSTFGRISGGVDGVG